MPHLLLSRGCHRRVTRFHSSALPQAWRVCRGCEASAASQSTRYLHTHNGDDAAVSSQASAARRDVLPASTPPPAAVGRIAGRTSAASRLAHRLQATPWGNEEGTCNPPSSSFSSLRSVGAARSSLRRDDVDGRDVPSPAPTQQRLLQRAPQRSNTPAPAMRSAATTTLLSEALAWSVGHDVAAVEDDDIVLDTPAALLPCLADSTQELRQAHQRHAHRSIKKETAAADEVTPESRDVSHPAARGVGQDVIDLVTDAFTAQREAEVARRRELLYELTHPDPADYTYNGKLVPPPPLSFGQITEEARSLGNKMMLGQSYSLVRQSGTRAAEDDISTGAAGTTTSVSPASTIETSLHSRSAAASSASSSRPYRSRARDDNVFRDHNYFFEVNELYQEIVLVGRACAGKSSLLNSLLGQNVARTSSSPNTTRKISFYQSVTPEQLHAFHEREHHNQLVKLPGGGLQLTFVDMPGYGIEGMSDQWRDAAIELTDAYFGVRRSVNTVLYCMDCERGLTKTDIKYFTWLENVQGTFFIVLTKCDSVPHSRVTSVMRQVYSLITKHRRKYRKVFPFIIPTSAKDGTNMELLRGLITETSGMIPGDKLRDLLGRKKEAFTQTALLEEASRLDAVRQLERAQAREFFQLTRGTREADGQSGEERALQETSEMRAEHPHRVNANPATASCAATPAAASTSTNVSCPASSRRYVVGLNKKDADAAEALFLSSATPLSPEAVADFPPTAEAAAAATAEARRERRERFLAWRRTHPLASVQPSYDAASPEELQNVQLAAAEDGGSPGALPNAAKHGGGGRYRLHSGLDSPQAAQTVLDIPANTAAFVGGAAPGEIIMDEEAEQHNSSGTTAEESAALTPPPPSARSSIIGFSAAGAAAPPSLPSGSQQHSKGGAVSRFLDVLEGFGEQPNIIKSAKQRRREAKLQRRHKSRAGGGGGLLAEDASGRLASYQAGKPCGPSLVSLDTAFEKRQATWRAKQLKEVLSKENPEAPWLAVYQLRRKAQAREADAALSGMRKKERAAYVRDAGSVTESFEKFESEVTAAKYVNEVRQAPTLRSQQQMHLNATAKINYRSMPPGLLKRYGEKDTYWPTPQVLGRAQDESHKP